MKKLFSFMAGFMSGVLVGGAAVLLLTPESGQQLRADAVDRWEEALEKARQARERTERQMTQEFERMKERGQL